MIAEEFAADSMDAMSFAFAPAASSPMLSPSDLIMSATESFASP